MFETDLSISTPLPNIFPEMKPRLRTNIIYFICFTIAVGECHSILQKGTRENVDTTKVLHIGDNVRLECSTIFSHSGRWSHIPDGNKHRIRISTGDQLSPEYAGNEGFRLDTSTGKYDLLINDLKKSDEGIYFCTTQEKEYSTQLVIKKKHRYLKESPTSVAVFKGRDVRLNCATSYHHPVYWTHIPVGKSDAIDVYVVGVLSGSYATSGRYNVEVDSSIGQYDLVIRQVQLEDAGTFVCIDDYGNGMKVSANVTVLDAFPVCESNASEVDGVLIENDCGLPPDLLHMTCRTTFAGSAEPQLRLKHSGVTYNAIAKETTKSDPNGHLVTLISRYILQPDFRMTTEELSCELNGLHRVPSDIACDIQHFKIQYIFNSTTISISKVLSPHKDEDTVTCSSNSSEPCSYKWIELQNPDKVLSISNSASFGPGKYVCIAECNIRGTICSFLSLPFHGAQQLCPVDNDCYLNYILLTILVSLFWILFVGTFLILIKKTSRVSSILKSRSKKNPHESNLLESKGDTINTYTYIEQIFTIPGGGQTLQTMDDHDELDGRSYTTDNQPIFGQATNEVRGLALIGGIVYVVRQNEKTIQAHSIDTGSFIRTILVNTLSKEVRDMASCAHCMCLYVADEDNTTIHKIQLRSGEQKEDIIAWTVPGVPESLYSKECQLLVSLHQLKQILILDKNGEQVWRIQLQQQPWHAIPVMSDMYMFSYTSSTTRGQEDKVCLVDEHGNIQVNFEDKVEKKLNKPGRMAPTKPGSLFIADYNNDRVVLLDSNLEPINENIISVTKPSRICFDEGRQRLLIASDNETHEVFVYQLGYGDL